jgi:hypothetical protein
MDQRLLLPFLFSAGTLSAQPVLDFNNIGTLPGSAYIYHACPWQDPGGAGADQTWDLSSFTTDSLIYISFIDPATTPDAASFPSATIAAEDTGGVYAYSAFTAAGGEFLGLSLPGQEPIVYSDPMTQVVFPCTFNTTWADDFGGSFTFGGYPVTRTGTVTGTADAYGTLTLPYGDFPDVLRATYVEDYDDVGFITISTHREYTYYIKAGTHYPLVQIYSFSTTVLGNTTTITGAQWMDAGSTQVQALAVSPRLDAYPVPANEELNVRCDGNGPLSLDLLDVQGRMAVQHIVNGTGPCTVRLDMRSLPAGAYTLRTIRSGSSTTRHVVIVH